MLNSDQMVNKLRSTLSENRFLHSLGVMETALKLAEKYSADRSICYTAGLLHDCAKYLSTAEMLKLIAEYSIQLYPGEENYPYLLHAPAGVAVAQRDYGVNDARVLSAIRCHTVGSRHMSLTDTIIFVSDFIEPNRPDFEGLESVRLLSQTDLDAAYELCRELTKAHCIETGQAVFTF